MQCPNCGGVVPDSAKVCGYCGNRLIVFSQPDPQTQQQPVQVEITPALPVIRSRLPRWVWLLIILAVLVFCLLALFLWLRPREGGGALSPTANPIPLIVQNTPAGTAQQTMTECPMMTYEVQATDTLVDIARVFNIPSDVIREYNNLDSDAISSGMQLKLPLCEQLPVIGLTPTVDSIGGQSLTPFTNEVVIGQPGDCNSFELVLDEYQGGVLLPPNTPISKIWILKNNGTCTWTQEYSFVPLTEELMGGLSTWKFPLTFPPGSEYPLSMDFVSPTQEGSYVAGWSVRDDKGVEFGRIAFLIVVRNP